MAIWEKGDLTGSESGDRFVVDPSGGMWGKILSPSFRKNDGSNDYASLYSGVKLILPDGYTIPSDGGGTAGEAIGLLLTLTKAS